MEESLSADYISVHNILKEYGSSISQCSLVQYRVLLIDRRQELDQNSPDYLTLCVRHTRADYEDIVLYMHQAKSICFGHK